MESAGYKHRLFQGVGSVVDARSALDHSLYLDQVSEVISSCLKCEVAHEWQSVLSRPVQLQFVRLAHISIVSAVASCKTTQT